MKKQTNKMKSKRMSKALIYFAAVLTLTLGLGAWGLEFGTCSAQNIGINTTGTTPDTSALLQVGEAANLTAGGDTKGLLCPHVNLTNITDVVTIATPANGLIVYNTNAAMTNGNGVGLYFYCSSGCATTGWKFMAAANVGPGTTGQVLASQGSGSSPQWSTLTSGGGGPTGCANCITSISAADATTYTWSACREKCRTSTEGTFIDWRMPTWDEAVYYGSGAFDPPGGWQTGYTWTSTPWDSRVVSPSTNGYWVVFYESNGSWIGTTYATTDDCRCVR
jgi:hypothetical protein